MSSMIIWDSETLPNNNEDTIDSLDKGFLVLYHYQQQQQPKN
jgi:hypothetical protein